LILFLIISISSLISLWSSSKLEIVLLFAILVAEFAHFCTFEIYGFCWQNHNFLAILSLKTQIFLYQNHNLKYFKFLTMKNLFYEILKIIIIN
jgi:hypothetical protein